MKKGRFLLVILVLCLLCSKVFASEITDDYFDIAQNYYSSNNLTKSLEYLDLILTIEPDNAKAKVLHDKISPPPLDKTQQAQDTTKVLETATEPANVVIVETPQADVEKITYDSDYYNKKGQEFYQKKDFKSAVEYFQKSIVLNQRNVQAYNNLAMSYWCQENTDAAIQCFKKANSINRCYTQPLVNLSNLYKQLGDKNKQFCYLQRAIKLNKNDYLAYYWLGDYYRCAGKYPCAIQNYKEVVKINPKFSQVYLNLAICFFETEEFNYSIMATKEYLEFCPNSDYAYFLMAKTYLAMGQYNEAKTCVQKAIDINDCVDYDYEFALIHYYLGDYDDAVEIFQNLLQYKDNAEIFNYVGLCNYKKQNINAAIINFKRAIEIDGLRPIYYYNLAQCYKSLGDKNSYVTNINTATRITPQNYQDYIDLSYIYCDNANPAYAINTLNCAIKKYPDVKAVYLAKLKIYETLNDSLHYNEIRTEIEKKFNCR